MRKSIIVVLSLLLAASAARAQIVNGTFTGGMAAWFASSSGAVSTYVAPSGGNPGGGPPNDFGRSPGPRLPLKNGSRYLFRPSSPSSR